RRRKLGREREAATAWGPALVGRNWHRQSTAAGEAPSRLPKLPWDFQFIHRREEERSDGLKKRDQTSPASTMARDALLGVREHGHTLQGVQEPRRGSGSLREDL